MLLGEILGRCVAMTIVRFGPPGAFLEVASSHSPDVSRSPPDVILLPGAEIPDGAKEGDEVRVFVYRDSEGRPIATTQGPKVEWGQVAFLTVTTCTQFGAFVDWGLGKELLVPFAEQTSELAVGDRHPIGLYIDKAERLAGTMKVSGMLDTSRGDFSPDEWVQGEAWRSSPEIGLFVIIERTDVGLVPATEPHSLKRGEAARFRVTSVLPDGKIELSLRGHSHEELEGDARGILEKLSGVRPPQLGDRSSPEEIRAAFGLSKKAFKRAVGRLLKDGAVTLGPNGHLLPRKR